MRTWIRTIIRALEAGQRVELISVLEATGSTPRGAGALLAVCDDGTAVGTVGGGNVEYEAVGLAKELLERGEDGLRRFRFRQGEAASLGMVCGGDVTLHFQCLFPEDQRTLELLCRWKALTEATVNVWLARRLEDERVAELALVEREEGVRLGIPPELLGDKAGYREGWFVIPAVKAGRVYIFGGGHVAQALVPAIAAVGFRAVVYDDRPEFADPARFPQAEEVLCGSFSEAAERVRVTAEDYVVIMTRGHQADYEVLVQTLRSKARYLGCIGSRKKLALCKERLLQDGFTEEEYGRLHAPIGLAIGAETPAEIAVSIAAELIGVRAGRLL